MIKPNFTILAIDTSCDETAAAVTCADRVLSNVIASQVQFHRPYGGVVPHLAKRMHQEFLFPTIVEALRRAKGGGKISTDIDAVAVTVGPGLAPALEVGIATTKQLVREWRKPLIAVNHMEAHLLSPYAKNAKGKGPFSKIKPQFPQIGLLVSGGHTQLVKVDNFSDYTLLGETLDDAAGEAFDKVAKMLDLGYPGGPIISELAREGHPKYKLPVPLENSPDFNFSFSGLKTACLYLLRDWKGKKDQKFYHDFSASFETAVIAALLTKLEKATKRHRPSQLLLGGGVIGNDRLRQRARLLARRLGARAFFPYTKKLYTDNAAMVGVCAWYQAKRGDITTNVGALDRQPTLSF